MITSGGGVTFSKGGGISLIFSKTSKEITVIYPKNRVFFQTNLENFLSIHVMVQITIHFFIYFLSTYTYTHIKSHVTCFDDIMNHQLCNYYNIFK